MSDLARCFAVTGTVYTGPLYCGNRAKDTDANGRPICNVHKRGNPGIEWRGEGHRYPYGDGDGGWKFAKGAAR